MDAVTGADMKVYKVYDTLSGACVYSSTVKSDSEEIQRKNGGEKNCYYLFEIEE